MEQIRTKKELLEAINKCRDDKHIINDTDKKKVFDEQVESINDVLVGLQESAELPGFRCLKFREGFGKFVTSSNVGNLKERLELIHHDLYEWREVFNNVIGTTGEVQTKAIAQMRKGKRTLMKVVISILGLVAVAALVLGILSAVGKISNEIGEIIGVLDCTLGVLFFAWELYDDKIKESKILSGDEELLKKHLSADDFKRYRTIIVAEGKGSQASGRDSIRTNGKDSPIITGNGNSVNNY